MSGITIAVLGIAGSVIVALLTWLLSLTSELHKSLIQKDHTKFASFHAKQVDTLAETYMRLSSINSLLKSLMEEWVMAKQTLSIGITEDINSILIIEDSRDKYHDKTRDNYEQLMNQLTHLKEYCEGHAVFIDQIILDHIETLDTKLEILTELNKQYINTNFHDNFNYVELNEAYSNTWEFLKNIMPKIKADVKKIMKD